MKQNYEQVLKQFEDIILRYEIEYESYNNSELVEDMITFISG